jgi:hypothetical protein
MPCQGIGRGFESRFPLQVFARPLGDQKLSVCTLASPEYFLKLLKNPRRKLRGFCFLEEASRSNAEESALIIKVDFVRRGSKRNEEI